MNCCIQISYGIISTGIQWLRKEPSSSELCPSHEFALLWYTSCYSKGKLFIIILSPPVRYCITTGGGALPSLEDTNVISMKFQNQPVAKPRNKFKTIPFLMTALSTAIPSRLSLLCYISSSSVIKLIHKVFLTTRCFVSLCSSMHLWDCSALKVVLCHVLMIPFAVARHFEDEVALFSVIYCIK